MRSIWWAAAAVAMACCLPGCGPDIDFSLGPIDISGDCAVAPYEDWTIIIVNPPPPIEVGSSREVTIGPPWPYYGCISSVRWWPTVEGIVTFEPHPNVDRAIITGEAPGRTHILAEVTLLDGTLRRARTSGNEPVTIVPASSGT